MSDCPLCGATVPPGATRCPYCYIDFAGAVQANPTIMGTPLAPAQAQPLPTQAEPMPVRQLSPTVPVPAPKSAPDLELPSSTPIMELPKAATTVDHPPAEAELVAFRPVRRPPQALLCVLDDGREDGEWVRIRTPACVIGRTEGDVRIPHDSLMSSRHASLTRQLEKDRYRWYLIDLQSTNGTYLKIAGVLLKHGQEMLIGSRRLRFQLPPPGTGPAPEQEAAPAQTQGWQSLATGDVLPTLVEITPQGEGQRFVLSRPENWIGRDPARCTVVLASDPLVNGRHARIYRDPAGRWHLENAKALNGTWLRVEKVPLSGTAQFQLGEQRFLVKFP